MYPPQAAYWKRRAGKDKKAAYVEYGNDVEGTAFSKDKARDPLAKTDWNMRVRAWQCMDWLVWTCSASSLHGCSRVVMKQALQTWGTKPA